jgi:hypothetical protein
MAQISNLLTIRQGLVDLDLQQLRTAPTRCISSAHAASLPDPNDSRAASQLLVLSVIQCWSRTPGSVATGCWLGTGAPGNHRRRRGAGDTSGNIQPEQWAGMDRRPSAAAAWVGRREHAGRGSTRQVAVGNLMGKTRSLVHESRALVRVRAAACALVGGPRRLAGHTAEDRLVGTGAGPPGDEGFVAQQAPRTFGSRQPVSNVPAIVAVTPLVVSVMVTLV